MNRRQILTGSLLGAAILGLSLWLWFDLQRPASGTGAAGAAGAPTNGMPAAVAVDLTPAASDRLVLVSLEPADGRYLATRWPEWLSTPDRDPFQMRRIEAPVVRRTNDVVAQLRLSATWLQSGGRFAVINSRVYGEGDVLAGFRVVRVDSDRVVLQGPESREEITFHSHATVAVTTGSAGRTNWVEGLMGRDKQTFQY